MEIIQPAAAPARDRSETSLATRLGVSRPFLVVTAISWLLVLRRVVAELLF